MQAFQPRANQELFSAFNHSPMGYSLPAAIGAYYATGGKRQIICIIGDGGLAMCSHELETIRYRDIPIKIFVIDNQGYGIMRQTQDTWLDGKHTAVDEDSGLGFVNLFEIWRAYFKDVCCSYWNIDFNNDFDEIQNALNDDNECPSFCSVRVSPDMIITPKLKFGKSIGDIE
jgi:acetolactate synthase-1/2/3 large subunit